MIEKAWRCIPIEVLSQVLQTWAKLSWPSLQWWGDPEPIEYFSKWNEFCRDSISCERPGDKNGLLQNGLLAKTRKKVVRVSSFCFVRRFFFDKDTLLNIFAKPIRKCSLPIRKSLEVTNPKCGDLKNVGWVYKDQLYAVHAWALLIDIYFMS